MRLRLMATYLGVPYQAGLGPDGTDVTLFSPGPPPEELGFTASGGFWRKQVGVMDLDGLWQSRPVGEYREEPCLVLDDLGARLHIAYLGRDTTRAIQLGYWEIDREVFEVVVARQDVVGLTEERVDFPLAAAMFPPSGEAHEVLSDPTDPPLAREAAQATAAAAASAGLDAGPLEPVSADHASRTPDRAAAWHGSPWPEPWPEPEPWLEPGPWNGTGTVTEPGARNGTGHRAEPAPWNPIESAPEPAPWNPIEPAPEPASWNGIEPRPEPAPWNGIEPAPEPAPWNGIEPGPESASRNGSGHRAEPSPWNESEPDPEPASRNGARHRAEPEPGSQLESWIGPGPAHEPGPQTEPGLGNEPAPWNGTGQRAEPGVGNEPASWNGTGRRTEPGPGNVPPPARRGRGKDRVTPQSAFAELLSLASISQSSYAVNEEVPGAMCLVKADGGYEVFSCTDEARLEVRFFEDEEAAYFYLFGVLAAEAIRSGRLGPRGVRGSGRANGRANGSGGIGASPASTQNVSKYLRGRK